MGKVILHPKAGAPEAIYPGVADMNREGVSIAVEMLCELECGEVYDMETGTSFADLSNIENWPREGRPFRNIVHEYFARARGGGPDVEAGFCAVLSDLVAQCSAGTCPGAEFYQTLYGIEEG